MFFFCNSFVNEDVRIWISSKYTNGAQFIRYETYDEFSLNKKKKKHFHYELLRRRVFILLLQFSRIPD